MITILIIAGLLVLIYGSAFWWARNEYLKQIRPYKQKPVLSKEADEKIEKSFMRQLVGKK